MTGEDINERSISPDKSLDELLPSRFLSVEQLISWRETEIIGTISRITEEEIKLEGRDPLWRPVIYLSMRDGLEHPQGYLLADQADREALKTATDAKVIGDLVGKKIKIKIAISDRISKPQSGAQIKTIAQELRQPLSSILGYTDLLLGESMGILGNLQRKFLNRIHDSAERMDSLISSLIKTSTLEEEPSQVTGETIDLNATMEAALAELSADIQEKNIALRTELPTLQIEVFDNSQTLRGVLTSLLRYVCSLTAVEGGIQVRGLIQNDEETGDFILLEITSIGGIFPAKDLNTVILGDLGSGAALDGLRGSLAIAKDQIETLGGRMWVDSGSEEGFTLSLLLPVLVLRETPGRGEPAG
jgi:signal transduction histidine kinase